MLSSLSGRDSLAENGREPAPDGAYAEDLPALAALEYRLAQSLCGDCVSYHALWGYSRIAGVNRGIVDDETIVSALLRRLSGPSPRVLIAGAADAGLLALTARALQGSRPRIAIADRCATPLAVCEHFGVPHRLDIATIQTELTEMRTREPFDIVLAHYVLNHIPAALRPVFLAGIHASLGERGKLLLAARAWNPPTAADGSRKSYSGIAAAIGALGIALPCTANAFARHAERINDVQHARDSGKCSVQEIEKLLANAKFRILERQDRLQSERPASNALTHFFVAAPSA